jgi:membrane fusion protein (multidrug efflux system)
MRISIKKSRLLLLTSIGSVAILLFGGCGDNPDKKADRGGSSGKGVALVEALIIKPRLLENRIYSTGTLLANEEVELRSEIAGRVADVYFVEGKKVNKAELLLKINDAELQAGLKRKMYEEKQAIDNLNRQKSLFEIQAISREDYDKFENSLKIIQAEKEIIQSQIDKTDIRAPFAGIIGLRYISEGGYVTPDKLIATIQNIDPIKVEFSIPEKYAGQLKTGTDVAVFSGDSPIPRHGNIYAIESKIDPLTRTIKARAKIPNSDNKLIPGSFAKVEIILNVIPDAIVIPSEAVIPQLTGQVVYLYKGGKAILSPVKTALRTDTDIQISEGISEGDTLITSGLLQLIDGKEAKLTALKN